jgi:uncharacterized protein
LIVVSDTSPLLNLAIVKKLHLLCNLYVEIVIPPAVEIELSRNDIVTDPSWVQVLPAQDQEEVAQLRRNLDPGEAEAIVLAGELGGQLLLIDEKMGRQIAISRGLEVTGLLGVLAEAKSRGLITECKPVLDELIHTAGFWIGNSLRSGYLAKLNESD